MAVLEIRVQKPASEGSAFEICIVNFDLKINAENKCGAP